jgi:hypothetical protein
MGQMQKNKDPERWLLRNRNGQAPSAATAAIFKTESGAGASGSGGGGASSLGPGGRRLRAVDSGANDLFGDDDDDDAGARRRREREMGGDGDIDEVDFEDEFADDEQTMEADDKEDDDAKELDVWINSGSTKLHRLTLIMLYSVAFNGNMTLQTRLVKATKSRTMTTSKNCPRPARACKSSCASSRKPWTKTVATNATRTQARLVPFLS